VATFIHAGLRLHYQELGRPEGRPVVLLHGLLLSSQLQARLADALVTDRVILLDLHGHGRSSKPRDRSSYRWPALADDVFALLDHLGLERAAVGGISLGANVALAAGLERPERLSAMLLEMPVLRDGIKFARPVFNTVATLTAAGRLASTPAAAALRRLPVPRAVPEIAAWHDSAGTDPGVVVAVLRGLMAEEALGGDVRALRRVTVPTLVVGHHGDPLHPIADARRLVDNLPVAELVEVSSILEHRLRPDRLAAIITAFLDGLDPPTRPRPGGRRRGTGVRLS
jgi:pimeloyl-ACP methyl ester carboxylesterase